MDLLTSEVCSMHLHPLMLIQRRRFIIFLIEFVDFVLVSFDLCDLFIYFFLPILLISVILLAVFVA